jgi:predicted N-acyltransferase
MKEFFLKGRLLFITKDNEAVAGALSLVDDGTLVFRRTGVLDEDETHIEGGVQLALYYFQIKYANEHKLRAVDSMMSAPFLNDGVHKDKREWGATVLPDNDARTWVYFFRAAPSEKGAHFFEINPTIVHSDKGLRGGHRNFRRNGYSSCDYQ